MGDVDQGLVPLIEYAFHFEGLPDNRATFGEDAFAFVRAIDVADSDRAGLTTGNGGIGWVSG